MFTEGQEQAWEDQQRTKNSHREMQDCQVRRKTKSITYYSMQPAHHLRLDMHAGENALLMKPMRRSLPTLPSLGSTTCPETWITPKTPPRGLRVHAAGLYFTRWHLGALHINCGYVAVCFSAVNKGLLLLQWKRTLDLCMPRVENPRLTSKVPDWHFKITV